MSTPKLEDPLDRLNREDRHARNFLIILAVVVGLLTWVSYQWL